MGNSFDDAIISDQDRFCEYALLENPNIQDFSDFQNALYDGLKNSHGEISETTIITLFENQKVKEAIKDNVDSDEYEKLYGNGVLVRREPVGKKQVITIIETKVHIRSYTRKGQPIQSYNKGYRKWTTAENLFVQTRVEKKISVSQITQEYNMHFTKSPRTKSSLTSKISKSSKSFNHK